MTDTQAIDAIREILKDMPTNTALQVLGFVAQGIGDAADRAALAKHDAICAQQDFRNVDAGHSGGLRARSIYS